MKYKVGDRVVFGDYYGSKLFGIVVEEADEHGFIRIDLCEKYEYTVSKREDDVCLFEKYMVEKIKDISEFVEHMERKFK